MCSHAVMKYNPYILGLTLTKIVNGSSIARSRRVSDAIWEHRSYSLRRKLWCDYAFVGSKCKILKFWRNLITKRMCTLGYLGRAAESICVTNNHAVGSSIWDCILPDIHSLSNNNLSLNAVLILAKEVVTCQNATELHVRYQYMRAVKKQICCLFQWWLYKWMDTAYLLVNQNQWSMTFIPLFYVWNKIWFDYIIDFLFVYLTGFFVYKLICKCNIFSYKTESKLAFKLCNISTRKFFIS